MKKYSVILLFFFSQIAFSQEYSFDELLQKGKMEFSKEYDQQDYSKAVEYLQQAVNLNPQNAEAHYFLGYAYSRLNSKDGKSMIDSDVKLTLKSSEQFETVIKLTPKYKGELVILDPYSKITAEWGSLAMSYWHKNIPDSAKWAFSEGKKRGGFSDYFLAINRKVLDACLQNSILISSGDNNTMPLWYLQIMETYRKDVSVIDISLLNTVWYPNYLLENKIITFDLNNESLNNTEYTIWVDSTITINDFSWIVKPSYLGNYLLRGDLLFMSLLRSNNFKREVYFTLGFDENQRLSLGEYCQYQIYLDKLTKSKIKTYINPQVFENNTVEALKLSRLVNKNSSDEMAFIGSFRYYILLKIFRYLELNDEANAKNLFFIMNKYLPEEEFPYLFESWKSNADILKERFK